MNFLLLYCKEPILASNLNLILIYFTLGMIYVKFPGQVCSNFQINFHNSQAGRKYKGTVFTMSVQYSPEYPTKARSLREISLWFLLLFKLIEGPSIPNVNSEKDITLNIVTSSWSNGVTLIRGKYCRLFITAFLSLAVIKTLYAAMKKQ